MPTALPRLSVVVSREQHQLLTELGKLQSRSAASIVRQMLDATTPLFRATLVPLRAAAAAVEKQPGEARRILYEALGAPDDPEGDEPTLLQLMGLLEGQLRAAGEPGRTERSEGAPATDAATGSQ